MSKLVDWIFGALFLTALLFACAAIIANRSMIFEYFGAAVSRLGEVLK